ncbi:helix-turn-helix domain-containing protein, partial [Olsenella sp. SW781]|uniref:helix-turn-helix domain-containing protein n=1 Tax=Olsenella sp. SW781 TaxID=2530046 RepID=UPI00143936B1
MPKRKRARKGPSERSYARLTRHERQTIERMLDRGKGCREIAREIGRAPSTVANEVERHRFVTSPR